jgi:hypothetical protein
VTILAVYGGGLFWSGFLWDGICPNGNFAGLKICHKCRSPTNLQAHMENLLQHLLSPQNLEKRQKKKNTDRGY